MCKNIIILLVFLICPHLAFGAGLSDEALAKTIIRASGMERLITSLPEQLEAQYNQKKPSSKNPELDTKVTQILLESFNESRANDVLLAYLLQNMKRTDLQQILIWLESPLGKRLTVAEASASTPEGRANLLRYAADLQANPPSQERIELIQRFEDSAQLTDSTLKFLELLIYGMLSGIKELTPIDQQISQEELDKQLKDLKLVMRPLLWQQMLLLSHFTYRDFSNSEIERYISFLNSETGRKYSQISIEGTATVFNDLFKTAMPKFEKFKNQQAPNKRPERPL